MPGGRHFAYGEVGDSQLGKWLLNKQSKRRARPVLVLRCAQGRYQASIIALGTRHVGLELADYIERTGAGQTTVVGLDPATDKQGQGRIVPS